MIRLFKVGLIVFTVISALFCVTKDSLAQRVRLSRQEKDLVQAKLDMIKNPVTVHIYTGGSGRGRTGEVLALLELMKTTSPLVNFVEHDIDEDESLKEDLGVNHGPVMALKGEKFFGISYYGYPAQLELEPFLDGVLTASGKMSLLSPSTSAFLAKLDQDVHIRVFVTPNWPFCPESVRLAYRFAAASDRISAQVVETPEFPEMGRAHQVVVVPKVWINERTFLEGISPEVTLVNGIRQSLDPSQPPGRLRR